MGAKKSKITREVEIISGSYFHHKNVLYEQENGLAKYDENKLKAAKLVVSKTEYAVNMLSSNEKLVGEAEIIGKKTGTSWYLAYFSQANYYRIRKRAYKKFMEIVEK